ncbi:MAG: hypothetical protein AAB289_00900 [Chloroflexota bacterium]
MADAAGFIGGFALTTEEGQVLLTRSCARYRMGCHPFIPQTLAHRLSGESFLRFIGRYPALLAVLGSADCET